jgi:toxin-antitoxin system PIN domain toxin
MRAWFDKNHANGWATCPITESGFVRVSSNSKAIPSAIGVDAARAVLSALRTADGHAFLCDDVSITDGDVPPIVGHRQVTDAHLVALARRRRACLVTFDTGVLALAQGRDVELLSVL